MYEEGRARIKFTGDAFLNPVAKFSRDLSIAFVKERASKGSRLLDPTAATGIRGIRYMLESGIKDATLLDINKKAAAIAKKNVRFNKVKAKVIDASIQEFANTTKERFDFIDFDPFGGVSSNIFDLMKVAKDKSYMMVTATDTAVLCGAHEKACVRLYDAKPMHNELCQETGIRILIGYIARIAAQFSFGITPLISISYAHYMRVFLKLDTGSERALSSVKSLGYAYYCGKCGYRSVSASAFPKMQDCQLCGARLDISGKMWAGSINDKETIAGVSRILKRIDGVEPNYLKFVDNLKSEPDVPLYYQVPKLTKKLSMPSISPYAVLEGLRKKGFAAGMTHFENSAIKTNATVEDINKILKAARAKA